MKVLDFGLAKALDPSPSGDPSESPTLTAAATQMGVIMGTAAYMSPEQAAGRTTDKRSDTWSFGVVVFEMITGQRLFTGETVSHVLAKGLDREIDFGALPTTTPEPLRRLLRRCLEREPKRRLRDLGEAVAHLEEATSAPTVESVPASSLSPRAAGGRQVFPQAVAASAVVAVISGLAVWSLTRPEPAPPPHVMRFAIIQPATAPLDVPGGFHNLVISPDGTQIIYESAVPGTGGNLHVRPIHELIGAPLRGGENAAGPFVSPDGQWVGFTDQVGRTLQKVSIFGGPPVTLAESAVTIYGAGWGTDDQIIFGTNGAGLFRVSGGGGEPEALTTLDPEQGEVNHLWPFIIPDREAVLFVIGTAAPLTTGQLAVLDLGTGEVTRLGLAGVSPHYVSTGHLVYAAEDASVRAAPFDANTLEVTGNPVPLVEGVVVKPSGAADFSISDNGRLVYASGGGGTGLERSLVWVDRDGQEEGIAADPGNYRALRLSPDGERAAIVVNANADDNDDVLIYDLVRDIPTRFTFDAASDSFPVWSPDGERVVFGSLREGGVRNLFWKAADGTGEANRLTTSPTGQFSSSWSPDGETLVLADQRDGGFDISILSMSVDPASESESLIQTEFNEFYPEISPDGRWMAYASNESGQYEVYVRPFPDVDSGRWQVSRGGGNWPVWAPEGQELFYRRLGDLAMMAAPIETDPAFRPGNPDVLFEAAEFPGAGGARAFDVAPDGQRFLMIKRGAPTDDIAAPAQITVVLNWFQELIERVPLP